MNQKGFAILIMALVAALCLSACKSGNSSSSTTKAGASSNSSVSGEASTEKQKEGEQKTTEKGEKATEQSGSSSSGSNQKQSTTAKSGSDTAKKGETTKKSGGNTDGWKKTDNGTVIKGDVRADVVKYGKATLDEGEQLIQQLAEGGLKGAKKIESKKSDTNVVYRYSGQRIGSDKTEYIQFEYIVQKGTGYLVTVIAENLSGLDTDISYILNNLASLAK